MFIDIHNHVIPDAVLRLAEQDSRLGLSSRGGLFQSPNHVPFPLQPAFHSPQEKVADLTGRGLWGAVISPAPVLFGYDLVTDLAVALCEASNTGMADFCGHAPDRLHWLANLPMQAPEVAARMLADAVAAGAVGAAIGTSIAGRRLDEPDYEVFWAQVEAIGRPVLIHPAFNCAHPALPEGAKEGVLRGMYLLEARAGAKLQLLGSGPILREALAAAQVLEREHGVKANVWSVTSWSELRWDGLASSRPSEAIKEIRTETSKAWITQCLDGTKGPIVAASDYVSAVAALPRAWAPPGRRYLALGTDGFGRSDTRVALRKFFGVDRDAIVSAALAAL